MRVMPAVPREAGARVEALNSVRRLNWVSQGGQLLGSHRLSGLSKVPSTDCMAKLRFNLTD